MILLKASLLSDDCAAARAVDSRFSERENSCELHCSPLMDICMKSIYSVLLACSLLTGCGTSTVSPPVANLTESPLELIAQKETVAPAQPASSVRTSHPPRYTARKTVAPDSASRIPPVFLSSSHEKLCVVNVEDAFPALHLAQRGGQTTELSSLYGTQATVVLFWQPDRWMARTALRDMQRDVAEQFAADKVAVVGVAVEQQGKVLQSALEEAKATFPQLLDTDGKAFASVGSVALPRIYVLDPTGKIVWFDIEYSESTRRELWQTLGVLTRP